MLRSIDDILYNLKSDKVKERQDALSDLRDTFRTQKAIERYNVDSHNRSDPKKWLVLFQALFSVVLREKEAHAKKAASTSTRTDAVSGRLRDAATAVRWLVEKSAQYMNKKVFNAVFDHLTQGIVRRGELAPLIAFEYIQALKFLLSWPPHLDHMQDDLWLRAVELGFNVVLCDPVRHHFEDDKPSGQGSGTSVQGGSDAEDDSAESSATPGPSTPTTRKRSRGTQETRETRRYQSSKDIPNSTPPTQEQIAFMSLLVVLLASDSHPLLLSDYHYLPTSILTRLHRFLTLYPTETSLHHDYLRILSSALSHLALNRKAAIQSFASSSWNALVGLWGTKNRNMKETLVIVLRTLFPFVTSELSTGFDISHGLGKLWRALSGEAETRWGVDVLSFDALRLQLLRDDETEGMLLSKKPFTCNTFRYGWHFDTGQALTWTIYELQADCAEKLYKCSESMSSSGTQVDNPNKRQRTENPITSLLHSIKARPNASSCVYRLQVLLFIIERHWNALHSDLQNQVKLILQQSITTDDATVQCWVFMCLASVAFIEGSTEKKASIHGSPPDVLFLLSTHETFSWDTIWTHAIRRSSVPAVCRAACHIAHTLLAFSPLQVTSDKLLTSQRLLLEIEAFTRDLDVQGPVFPYDSACAFLSGCLKTARQDARLYHMQSEDKVMNWLMDSWRFTNIAGLGYGKILSSKQDQGRMHLHTIQDMLSLLETICLLGHECNLECRILLPCCAVVDTAVEEGKMHVIREYVLNARVSTLSPVKPVDSVDDASSTKSSSTHKELVAPRAREQKLSSFLLKYIEDLLPDWETLADSSVHPSAEKARRSLDLAIVALYFQSLLVRNGTRSNRRLMQQSCKLISLVSNYLPNSKWTVEEKSFVLVGIEPLVISPECNDPFDGPWQALLSPGVHSGIKQKLVQTLRDDRTRGMATREHERRTLQRIIWKSADVQDAFIPILQVMQRVFRDAASTVNGAAPTGSIVDMDGFGGIRTTQSLNGPQFRTDDEVAMNNIIQTTFSLLSLAPVLQSSSCEPTRDTEMVEFILRCGDETPESFLPLLRTFVSGIRQKSVSLSTIQFESFLDILAGLLQEYRYSRSTPLQMLVASFLDATYEIWFDHAVATGEIGRNVRQLCNWFSENIRKSKIRPWKVRDYVMLFIDRYIRRDPDQKYWSVPGEVDDEDERQENFPSNILPCLGADPDVRIRFRAAIINANLFNVAQQAGFSLTTLYQNVLKSHTIDMSDYEGILTRLISLGNIMIVSSSIRRGPYWHLLETCLYNTEYSRHIESILTRVAECLGLERFSMLFEAYATQIASSIRDTGQDFLRFQPRILGFEDRTQCAKAAFRAFTPANLLSNAVPPEAIAHGEKLFKAHCKVIGIEIADGIRQCFGSIIGLQIASATYESNGTPPESLKDILRQRTMFHTEEPDFDDLLAQNADAIICAILRTLGERNCTMNGPIIAALQESDSTGDAAAAFQTMTMYRLPPDTETQLNAPAYPPSVVLASLEWFLLEVPHANGPGLVYHVLHQNFADIQTFSLVDEQIRLLTSTALWVAKNAQHFDHAILLHTLVHGALFSLVERDLAPAAQSIIHWAFSTYPNFLRNDRLPDILLRICHAAYDYIAQSETAPMGKKLLQWINQWTVFFSQMSSLQDDIQRAFIVWPDQGFADPLIHDATTEAIYEILGHDAMPSNKFRVAKRLYELSLDGDCEPRLFAKAGFWSLKECIASTKGSIREEDAISFAALLSSNLGLIKSFGNDSESMMRAEVRYRRGKIFPKINGKENLSSFELHIIMALCSLLQAEGGDEVHGAYKTLRFFVSVWNPRTANSQVLSVDSRAELELLRTYPLQAEARPSRHLQELEQQQFEPWLTRNFRSWIAKFAVLISDILSQQSILFAQLSSLLESDTAFAERMLPLLIHNILLLDDDMHRIRTYISSYFCKVLSYEHADVACSRCIVDVVLYLRHHISDKNQTGGLLGYNQWLHVDLTKLAHKAVQYGSYTTALLFLELAADNREFSPKDEALEEEIMFEIYSHIDEPDGFYGVKTRDLQKSLFKRFYHEKQWEKAFRFHGAAIESGKPGSVDSAGLVKSFHSFGFNRLAMETLQQQSTSDDRYSMLPAVTYQLGWRTETWDLPTASDGQEHDSSLYFALRAVHRERDNAAVNHTVTCALLDEVSRLQSLGNENLADIRLVARNLMCLSQIVRWTKGDIQNDIRRGGLQDRDWKDFVSISSEFMFEDLETIMATRVSLVRSLRLKEERERIGDLPSEYASHLVDIEKKCLIRLSVAAREANMLQIALNSISRARRLEQEPSFEAMEEFTNVLWAHSERKLAVQFLKGLVLGEASAQYKDAYSPLVKAALLARLGAWASDACLENPADIVTTFFDPAISLISDQSAGVDSTHATIYHQYAVFAEHQYQNIVKSPDAVRFKLYKDRKNNEIQQLHAQIDRLQPGAVEERAKLESEHSKARRLLGMDTEAYDKQDSALTASLRRAIDMYARCLEVSDGFDDDGPIRLCSLWFAHFGNPTIQDLVESARLSRIPSRKFVFLAHQLSARLSRPVADTVQPHQKHLQDLILRMCLEHPFHSIYQVYCLQADRASAYSTQSRRQSSRSVETESSQAERSGAASDLLSRLCSDKNRGERIQDVQRVCEAYLQWAKHPIVNDPKYNSKNKKPDSPMPMPANAKLLKLNSTKVPIPTIQTALDPTLLYESCIYIEKYDPVFETAGGVSLPKINNCVGSDGKKYKQLFKGEGNDDLRQDAVMEQVFDLVNRILRRDRATKDRDLRIRGYAVIPLASQAGVLQFVANTMPLGPWLHRAHWKYRPDDLKHNVAWSMMNNRRREPKENRIANFLNIRQKFKPVMRHYFTERSKTPMAWFAMRLCYTRSVATSSIIGHILGLGDRHCSNILLDNGNGEVVHIDLGVAFDQGKTLPEPERVPFRMTADIVDGMGSAGTEGVFQRCAEETLRVMREGSEIMMTVLEVFKHDPLHSWTASKVKVHRMQPSTRDQTVNDLRLLDIDINSGTAEGADRALSSVARKLDKTMTVEFTVNELVAEATDISNLATIYHGWAPYL